MIRILDWSHRFAIIERYKVSDSDACKVFHISQNELEIARGLKERDGLFGPDPDFNPGVYAPFFNSEIPTPKVEPNDKEKKRGRQSRKIKDAYEAVTATPVSVEGFMKTHGISLSVLRRHKNFDHIPETGQINVRKILLNQGDVEKTLCIWREKP